MTQQNGESIGRLREEGIVPPEVIVLGDAAVLTKGGSDTGVEAKQTPYD